MIRARWSALAFLAVSASACGEPGSSDAGGVPDGASVCVADGDCDDGLYCSGEERCAPDDPDADARGCVRGDTPCADDEPCSELTERCEADCPDADGDGATDASCGGTDCNDADRAIFPGATELCDEAGVDDDCDPTTLGSDVDGDGAVGVLCCNRVGSNLRCGTDCDDTRASINPEQNEVCNGFDDDCDATLDEGVTTTYYRDRDGDLFGDASETVEACTPPTGFTILPGDCDDSTPLVNPGATESCTRLGTDEDCDGAVDEVCECEAGVVVTCGPGAPLAGVGICRDGMQTCSPAGIFGDCEGGVFPGAETCDGLDEDCDAVVDEGGGRECPRDATLSGTTRCGRMGTRRCSPSCTFLDAEFIAPSESAVSCDYCYDTSVGAAGEIPFALNETEARLGTSRTAGDWVTSGVFLNPGTSAREVGIIWSDELTLGYGTITVRGRVIADAIMDDVTSEAGWALAFVRADSVTVPSLGSIADFGIPATAEGWRFDWQHSAGRFSSVPSPVLELRELPSRIRVRSGGGAISTSDFQSSGAGTRDQQVELSITPDDPRTPLVDETQIAVRLPNSSSPSRGSCRNEGSQSCRRTLRPGDVYVAAVAGYTDGGSSGRISHNLFSLSPVLEPVAEAAEACPP